MIAGTTKASISCKTLRAYLLVVNMHAFHNPAMLATEPDFSKESGDAYFTLPLCFALGLLVKKLRCKACARPYL
jgi:hypothetical protein